MTLLTAGKNMEKADGKGYCGGVPYYPANLYYHFADIPEMFRWILEQQGQRAQLEA